MSQQEFLCRHSSCVALQILVVTGNSPPSCFGCRNINNLCHDRDFVALGYEFLMLCHDRIFFVATAVLP